MDAEQYLAEIQMMEEEEGRRQREEERKRKRLGHETLESARRNQKIRTEIPHEIVLHTNRHREERDIEAVEYENDGVTIKQREFGPVMDEYGNPIYDGKRLRDKVLDEMLTT